MTDTNSRQLYWCFMGLVSYTQATHLQLEIRQNLADGQGTEHLLFLEHPHVYTLGRNAHRADILAADHWLATKGVEVQHCDRGGQVTYHGPGQLVGYPIVNLSPDRRDIRRFVQDLQEVLIRTLADFGVRAQPREGKEFIGVWVGNEKIASIGVHLSRWLTTHGFALNITTDLSFFQGIVPCGLQQVGMTSLEALTGQRPSISDVAKCCASHFSSIFERTLIHRSPGLPSLRGDQER